MPECCKEHVVIKHGSALLKEKSIVIVTITFRNKKPPSGERPQSEHIFENHYSSQPMANNRWQMNGK